MAGLLLTMFSPEAQLATVANLPSAEFAILIVSEHQSPISRVCYPLLS
jgi:hypothetical protein